MKLGKPEYLGSQEHDHASARKTGVLLANLGTPDAPQAKSVRPYLRQFLSDPRVVETPRVLWWLLLNLLIVPFRSAKSAVAYRQVWSKEGSPLLAISKLQRDKIALALGASHEVELGMSYGTPSIKAALRELHRRNCGKILVLPLYPQYAGSTVGSVFDSVSKEISSWRWVPQLRFIAGYCQRPGYPALLADSLKEQQEKAGAAGMTLFSFHGTQLASLEAGDPYHCQCHRTARECAQLAGLAPDEYLVTFQSRFGRDPWLQPYTSEVLRSLPARGVKSVRVICPAFSCDCLETLWEIEVECRAEFIGGGGESFSYVPALNDRAKHIEFFAELIRDETCGWNENNKHERDPQTLTERARRAELTAPLTRGLKKL